MNPKFRIISNRFRIQSLETYAPATSRLRIQAALLPLSEAEIQRLGLPQGIRQQNELFLHNDPDPMRVRSTITPNCTTACLNTVAQPLGRFHGIRELQQAADSAVAEQGIGAIFSENGWLYPTGIVDVAKKLGYDVTALTAPGLAERAAVHELLQRQHNLIWLEASDRHVNVLTQRNNQLYLMNPRSGQWYPFTGGDERLFANGNNWFFDLALPTNRRFSVQG